MKQIKKIVLKDATKLTNSEMKKIRGGVEQGYSQTCSAVCYTSTGAILGSFEQECDDGQYCELVSGAAQTTLGCFITNQYLGTPELVSKLKCSDVYKNYI